MPGYFAARNFARPSAEFNRLKIYSFSSSLKLHFPSAGSSFC